MRALEEWIMVHPYLFRVVGSVILFWVLWIPFGNKLMHGAEVLVNTTQEAWKAIFQKK